MGDVLLHIVLLAQMGREAGTFAFEDVVAAVSAKMVRRHPHVFAGLEVATVDEVLANWQRIKAEERAEAGR
jgi:tetrapyrrole methylase family protein/MazG family protein